MKNTGEKSYLVLSFVVSAWLFGTPAYAQDKIGEIDKIFSWAMPDAPGCAVAISQNGKLVVNRAYGSADLERDVPLSPDTVFDAGSVRKQFVAASILLLVEEGRLALSDDVRKFIPELPDYGNRITLNHMLTHTHLRPVCACGAPARARDRAAAGRHRRCLARTQQQGGALLQRADRRAVAVGGGPRQVCVAGGPGLVSVTKERFRRWGAGVQSMSGDEFELHFQSPNQLELKSMEGKTTAYRRAQPYLPTEDDLKAFAGRYGSDELKAVIQLAPAKGGLIGRINDGPAAGVPFAPVDRDTFQVGMLTIRFRRDPAGKLVGLDFSNPVLRKIDFTQLSER